MNRPIFASSSGEASISQFAHQRAETVLQHRVDQAFVRVPPVRRHQPIEPVRHHQHLRARRRITALVHDVVGSLRLHAEHPIAIARIMDRAHVLQPFQPIRRRHRHHGLRAALLVRCLACFAEHSHHAARRFHDGDGIAERRAFQPALAQSVQAMAHPCRGGRRIARQWRILQRYLHFTLHRRTQAWQQARKPRLRNLPRIGRMTNDGLGKDLGIARRVRLRCGKNAHRPHIRRAIDHAGPARRLVERIAIIARAGFHPPAQLRARKGNRVDEFHATLRGRAPSYVVMAMEGSSASYATLVFRACEKSDRVWM